LGGRFASYCLPAGKAVLYALASFSLDRDLDRPPVNEIELKDLANCLRAALTKHYSKVGDIWGKPTICFGFPLAAGTCEIDVMLSPPQVTFNKLWCVSVSLGKQYWFRKIPEEHLSDMKRVEWDVHNVLLNDLQARELFWSLRKGRLRRRTKSPTP
jgi:hypothetical protein